MYMFIDVCVYVCMSSYLVWGVLDARGNQVLLSYTLWIARKDCLVWTHDHHHCDDQYDQNYDVDETQGKKRWALVKELVIIPEKYTPSYYTCSGWDTLDKKYGNLMKHIKRPIFPRHNQSALTLIVVQKTEWLYFTVFRGVESNMEIWKLQWTLLLFLFTAVNSILHLKSQNIAQIPQTPKSLQFKVCSCLTHKFDTHGLVCCGS